MGHYDCQKIDTNKNSVESIGLAKEALQEPGNYTDLEQCKDVLL